MPPKLETVQRLKLSHWFSWLSLKMWEWTFSKSSAAAKFKQSAGGNSRFLFCEGFFLFWLLLPSPWWTWIPMGCSWDCRNLQNNPWCRTRGTGSVPLSGTGIQGHLRREKEEWTGQAGCRHIIKDSPWRVNSLFQPEWNANFPDLQLHVLQPGSNQQVWSTQLWWQRWGSAWATLGAG